MNNIANTARVDLNTATEFYRVNNYRLATLLDAVAFASTLGGAPAVIVHAERDEDGEGFSNVGEYRVVDGAYTLTGGY